MIKKVLLSLLIIPTLLISNDSGESFTYLHAGGWGQDKPYGANLGIGNRKRLGKIGYGYSADVSTILHIPIVASGKGELLYFLSSSSNSYYTGVSGGLGTLYFPNDGIFIKQGFYPVITSELLLGKQMIDADGKHSFVNVGINPLFSLQAIDDGQIIFPTIAVSYAWEY